MMNETSCSLCLSPIGEQETVFTCSTCMAVSHRDCREENGGCGTYGCAEAPPPEKQAVGPAAAPVWGQETKSCPKCEKTLKAAALRCRWCGAEFGSVEPIGRQEFAREAEKRKQASQLKREASAIFVLGAIPLTAPLIVIVGGLYLLGKRAELAAIPPLQRLLVCLGLGVGVVWTLLGAAIVMSS